MRLAVKSASCATPKCARSTLDYDDDDSTAPNFVDHFSLRQPSSTIKFRGARVHVYETSDEQILLEDRRSSGDFFGDDYDGDKRHPRRHNITVKRVSLSNFGVFILRMAYVVVSLFIFGLCLAFSFQIILSLFIQVAAGVNESISSNWDFFNFQLLGVLLSTPVFLFGFSSLMVLATTFVSEAWTGGHLIRAVIGAPSLVKEVLFFVAFILVPALTFIIALLIDSKNPWKVTCAAWVISVLLLFCSFAFAIVWCEIVACFRLLSIHYEDDEGGKPSFFSSVKRSILLIQRQRFAGRQSEQYLVTDDCVPPDGGFTFSDNHKPTDVKKGIYARITQLGFLSWFFDTVDPPTRLYSMEEVQDVMPFFTKYSWSLESVFCTGSRRRKIIAAKGPAALKPEQIMSSFACNVIGTSIIILTGVSYLLWVQRQNIRMILTFGILCIVICLYPLVKSYKDMFQMYKDMKDKEIKTIDHQMYKDMNKGTGKKLTMVDEETAEGPGDGVEEQQTGSVEGMSERIVLFRLWEEARVSQPKAWVCYTAMVWEFLFLILLPAIFLLNNQDFWSTAVFIVLGIFSFLRKYFDASAILCELGSMNTIDVEIDPGKPRRGRLFRQKTFKGVQKTLVLKSRLAEIVSNVSRGSAATGWACFFAVLIVGFFALSFLAVISEDGLGDRPPIVLLDDFAYPSEETLQYPTCSMRKGFDITTDSGATFDTKLADYAFLAAISYETTNVTDYLLPKWFTEGEVVDEDEFVKQYRAETGTQNARVYFKFFTFADWPDGGVLAIRGSQTTFDWMTNIQLWSASALAQFVKWLTPYGWIWSPIIDRFVQVVSMVQTETLERISYYKVTTEAVNRFKETYPEMRVTGGSLGGGLAQITGAQARVPAIAISGPGAEFSRRALSPPITLDDINKYVYNYVPDRDFVARIGGRPRQHQEGECIAPTSDIIGCHSLWRSVCEINYRCGSGLRPVLCDCHFDFGYPEPLPIGNTTRSFKEACIEEEQAFREATGSTKTKDYLSF